MAKVYRDGFGQPIPNEDEMIRATVAQNLAKAFEGLAPAGPRVEYTGNARAGSVRYVDGELRIDFWYEMGGGSCKLFINLPPPDQWEQQTNAPLSRRDEIVHFVATTVRREQGPSWRYEISSTEIAYY
ncbi:hypothetical protein [Spirosoma rigui]|uniref:hypothetical protein n=1 Tax=Spirosoma rigui TaxID=564064 RepID=UPI0009B15A8B|nr:hypothetical protein [Spirosoma rigui]